MMRFHWTEYAIDGILLGLFMISACLMTALVEHPASFVSQAITSGLGRRALVGIAMAATAVGLIYSPWGKRSGAHLNPSVTLAFWRLGRVKWHDAFGYITAQCVGAILGVGCVSVFLKSVLAHPSVQFAQTLPGVYGVGAAWVAEVLIAFFLMWAVLNLADRSRLAPYTGLGAGILIFLYITFEAQLSGMSMNPARSLGSAVFSGQWKALWIYFTAPPVGMLIGADVFQRWDHSMLCAKLIHDPTYRCIFCEK